jgi:hypothetical protein
MFSTVAVRWMTVSQLLGTVTLHVSEKSSKYAAILWLISTHLDHEVLGMRECGSTRLPPSRIHHEGRQPVNVDAEIAQAVCVEFNADATKKEETHGRRRK